MRAAFCSFPADGHVNPTLPFVAELVRRGVAVDYHATEAYRGPVERAGARYFELPGAAERMRAVDPSHGLFALAEMTAELSLSLLPPLREAVERDPPDVIVHDAMAPWGRLLAEMTKVRRAATYPSFATRPERLPLPPVPLLLLFTGPRSVGKNLGRLRRRTEVAREVATRFGVSELGFPNVITNPSPCNIVFTSERFQVEGQRLDDSFHFVGPCLGDRPPDPEFPLASLDGKKVVYASLGTVFNADAGFYRRCLEAFGGRDEMLVLSVGSRIDVGALGTPPPNCIVRARVPQLEVLKRASLFITHGGMNSVSEGLLNDVPLLVYPQAADQFLVARRVGELGVGRRISKRDLEPERLRRLAETALADDAMKRSARDVGETLRTAGGVTKAADVLMAYVAG